VHWAAGDSEAAEVQRSTATTRVARAQAGISGTRFASFIGISGSDFARHRDNPGPWLRIGPTNNTATGW
jgi:hypothetical protein